MRSEVSVIKELETLGVTYLTGSCVMFRLIGGRGMNRFRFKDGVFYYWKHDPQTPYIGTWSETTTKDIPTILVLYK